MPRVYVRRPPQRERFYVVVTHGYRAERPGTGAQIGATATVLDRACAHREVASFASEDLPNGKHSKADRVGHAVRQARELAEALESVSRLRALADHLRDVRAARADSLRLRGR